MKVNIEEKTRLLNEFRINSGTKTFTYGELRKSLGNVLSKNNVIIAEAIKLFPYEVIGKSRIYEMPKEPIHKSFVKAFYNRQASVQKAYYERNMSQKIKPQKVENTKSLEEKALELLSSKGYQIRKCVGFDLERFSKENPEMYKKYLKYEII